MGQQGQYVLAVLVDGAEKGPRGAELARYWAEVAVQALSEATACSPVSVHAHLKLEQAQLRHGFLRDIASYCMVSLDLETLVAQIWHCGDCRVGLRHRNDTQWLTTPHLLYDDASLLTLPVGAGTLGQIVQNSDADNFNDFRHAIRSEGS